MYETDSESNPRVWKILAGVIVVSILLISVWSCNANRDQRLAAEKVIEQQDAEITRLGGEVDKANQIIQQQNVALECYAKKSNDTELLSFVANLIFPGAGGAMGSALGQQQKC